MKIRTKYRGGNDPFEGDRILWLRSLPSGANITAATVTLIPANAPQFEETVTFAPDELSPTQWGISKSKADKFLEVDFHARRTLVAVEDDNLNDGNLQVDLGGAYVEINNKGTIKSPGDELFFLTDNKGKLPSLTVNKFKLSWINSSGGDITKVIIRSVPTNVSVRLGQLPPFWTRLGELATSDTSPNFATVFNAFLATAQQQDGFYQIPLIVHSDTIARLDVEIIIEFFIEQRVLPPHLPEVKLAYGFSTLPSVDRSLTTVTLPKEAQAIALRTNAKIIGEFNPTRIAFGSIGDNPTSIPSKNAEINVLVSRTQQLAQPLNPGKEIAVTGIDVPLGTTEPALAGLNISIQSDADGKPSGEVLASAELRVDKPLPNQSTWGSATLPTPFRVETKKRYWLILQSQVGEAHWLATDDTTKDTTGNPGLQTSRDGGLSWRIATVEKAPSPLKALFRLRTVPENFTVPVQLQIGKDADAVRLRLDNFAPLGRIEFSFDFAKPLNQYLAKTATTNSCGSGDLLVNGDFSDPPPDNATRKLFGSDPPLVGTFPPNIEGTQATSSRLLSINGTVDLRRGINLSVERFIVLALNHKPIVRIDCAGENPARTQLNEIIQAINTAMGASIADEVDGRLRISSNNSGRDRESSIKLYPWCSTQVTGWQGTRGQIFRINLSDEHTRDVLQTGSTSPFTALVLANPNLFSHGEQTLLTCFPVVPGSPSTATSAEASQRFSVVAGCAYLLQISFLIHSSRNNSINIQQSELPSPPRWGVVWFDKSGAALRSDRDILEFETRIRSEEPKPWFYEARLNAPPNAVQAELSFVNQSSNLYPLILEKVTFTPTSASLRNSYFRQWEGKFNNKLPAGWKSLGGWIDEEFDPKTGQMIGAKLRGDGPEDAVLVQIAEVVAGDRYELQVYSQLLSASNSDETRPLQERSRIELYWLGNITSTAVIIPLDGGDFPTHTWLGIAPDGVTSAEIRIVQPNNQNHLLIESVSLSRSGLVDVPLIFLSEAPGELTVSDFRVAYDLPSPPAPPNPSRSNRNTPILPQAKAFSSLQLVVEQPQATEIPPVPQPVTPPLPPPPAPPAPLNTAVEPTPTQIQEEPDTSDTSVEETPNLPQQTLDPLNEEPLTFLPQPPEKPDISDTFVEETPNLPPQTLDPLNEEPLTFLSQPPEEPDTSDTSVEETPNLPPQTLDPLNEEPLTFLPQPPVVEPPKEPDSPETAYAKTQDDPPQPAVAEPIVKKILLQTIPKIILILPAKELARESLTLLRTVPNNTPAAVAQSLSINIALGEKLALSRAQSPFLSQQQLSNKAIVRLLKKLSRRLFSLTN